MDNDLKPARASLSNIDLSSEGQVTKDWTDAEERKVRRKVDLILLPLLLCGFFALQLDRSNISNALTSSIVNDIHVASSDTISAGNQLQSATIVIFEIPSMILLQRIGAPIWITFQIIVWGMIALFQAFITNKSSYFATRFLLGMFEAGFIPACMYILAQFYKRDELAMRTAVFYVGNYFSAGTGSLIAAGVFKLDGASGLSGWQWLFIIDGTFTVLVGFLFMAFLPRSPTHTRSLLLFCDPFSEHDRHIMHNRIIIDDPLKEVPITEISLKDLASALKNFRLWGHFALNMFSLAPKGGLQLFSPSIIKKLGFSTTKANALSSVSNYGVIVLSLLISWASDVTKQRGIWCIVSGCWSLIFAGALYGLPVSAHKWTRYSILTLLSSGNAVAQGLNDTWLNTNSRTPQERSIGLALAVMGSNLAGLAGQNLFRAKDAPRYTQAFLGILCLYAASLVAAALQTVQYLLSNKALDKKQAAQEVDGNDELTPETRWRYEL